MKKCSSKDIRVGARIYAPATGATGYFQALENKMLIIAWDQGTSTYLPLDFDNPNDVIRIIEWFDCCNLVLLDLPVLLDNKYEANLCVFCESNELAFNYDAGSVSVACLKCGASSGASMDCESAVHKWNRAWCRVNEPKAYTPGHPTVVCGQWKLSWDQISECIVWEKQAKVVCD